MNTSFGLESDLKHCKLYILSRQKFVESEIQSAYQSFRETLSQKCLNGDIFSVDNVKQMKEVEARNILSDNILRWS